MHWRIDFVPYSDCNRINEGLNEWLGNDQDISIGEFVLCPVWIAIDRQTDRHVMSVRKHAGDKFYSVLMLQ